MIFTETPLKGAYIIEPELIKDERGFFARSWCKREFEEHGLNTNLVQTNISFNHKKGTLRGLHYQTPPNEEAKLLRCTTGSVYDVIIDLRKESPTFKKWFGIELTSNNRKMIYVPEGFANGYQALEDGSEITYNVSEFYRPEYERKVRYNDPLFAIAWPLPVENISDKDRLTPNFQN